MMLYHMLRTDVLVTKAYITICDGLRQAWGYVEQLKVQVIINIKYVYCCNYDILSMKLVNFSMYKFCHVN